MKKLSYLLGLMAVAGLMFSSCSKDEDSNTAPSLQFLGGISPTYELERVTGDVTMETGKPLVFGFTATSTTNKNLASVTITRTYENVAELPVWDTTLSTNTITKDIKVFTYPNAGSEVFEIVVTDRNDMTSKISFTVTTTQPSSGIATYTGIKLGSYDSPTNSSFASITGKTYSMTEAEDPEVQKQISWIYFQGVNYGHTLMSPANDVIVDVYSGVGDWDQANRNTTLMAKTGITTTQYELVSNKSQLILTIQNDGAVLTKDFCSELMTNPQGFAVDDIIAFESEGTKRGLIRITEVNVGGSYGLSTIRYDVKVENE